MEAAPRKQTRGERRSLPLLGSKAPVFVGSASSQLQGITAQRDSAGCGCRAVSAVVPLTACLDEPDRTEVGADQLPHAA